MALPDDCDIPDPLDLLAFVAARTEQVVLATGHAPRCARFYRGRDVVTWLADMGYYEMPVDQHPLREGVWAVEPHIATPDQCLGSKWEEILVVTKDNAYWLNDDATHCRRGVAAGWWHSTQRPAVEALAGT